MKSRVVSREISDNRFNPRFLKFIELFVPIDTHEKLFPKECRTCGRTYGSLSEYLLRTVAKGHTLDNAEEVMGEPFTMTYRHCACGNTLVLTFTAETYPVLGELWSMLGEEARSAGKPLNEAVMDFVDQWERYMLAHAKRHREV
ncbi:MAG: hypothetical protein RDU20_14230 [Desulfomonilaceae bacterium]|nr:hypothetical protein [Desulfomonilaceae bacterium]